MAENPCNNCGTELIAGAAFCPRCGTSRITGQAADPMIGRTIIGQYVIRRRLGEGGMGAVYLAEQSSVGRQAVIKVMHPSVSQDPSVAPRFEVEARAASQLNHPHIITIYNYGAMEDGTLFLAMEYCNGQSLEEFLRQGPLTTLQAVTISAQICDALAEAHGNGVVHRDLKPSNIMLTRVGRQAEFVKVLDFGIAKLEGVKMTLTGSVIGTPQYMSPEQLRGESLDGRADLYSLGVMIYEMVAGVLPFKSDSAAGYMHKHLMEAPKSPITIRPDMNIPGAMEAIILRALAKDRDSRFRDAEEMVRSLELVAADADVSKAVIPMTRVASAVQDAPVVGEKKRRTGLWLAIGGSSVVAAAAAAAIVILWRGGDPPAAERTGWRDVGSRRAKVWKNDQAAVASSRPAARGSGALPAPAKAATGSAREEPKAQKKLTVAAKPARKPRRAPRQRVAMMTPPPMAQERSMATSQPPRPPAPKPPGGRYDKYSADRLEKLLKQTMSTARIPPSTMVRTFDGYKNAMSKWPADSRDTMRRQFLINMIKQYKKPSMQLKPGERKSLGALQKIFLSMKMKADLTMPQRKKILANALGSYDSSRFSAQDRSFYKRISLLGMIKRMADSPRAVLR